MKSEMTNATVEHILESIGLETIEKDWSGENCHIDYICLETKRGHPYTVFLDTAITHNSMDHEFKSIEEFERVMTEWCKATDVPNSSLRYDTLILNVISKNRALVKHQIKVY